MRPFLSTFLSLFFALVIAVFICATVHKKHCSKSLEEVISDQNPILLGDSHAAQLDLTNVHEVSSEGSSLFIPLEFVRRYGGELPEEKTILISVWHQNITANQEEISRGISSASHSLKMFAETSTVFDFSAIYNLPTFKSKLLYFCGYLGIHHNILDGSGTCFESELQKMPTPKLTKRRSVVSRISAIEEINRLAKEDNLRIMWVISPEIKDLTHHYATLNLQLDSLLTLNKNPNVSVLDLRSLNLPLDYFRDEHHINCKPKALIDSLVRDAINQKAPDALFNSPEFLLNPPQLCEEEFDQPECFEGLTYIDGNGWPGAKTPPNYYDDHHLVGAGARDYSDWLAREIAKLHDARP